MHRIESKEYYPPNGKEVSLKIEELPKALRHPPAELQQTFVSDDFRLIFRFD